jgi:hypothetical protein
VPPGALSRCQRTRRGKSLSTLTRASRRSEAKFSPGVSGGKERLYERLALPRTELIRAIKSLLNGYRRRCSAGYESRRLMRLFLASILVGFASLRLSLSRVWYSSATRALLRSSCSGLTPSERGLTAGSDARALHGDESQRQREHGPLGRACGTRSAVLYLSGCTCLAHRSPASMRDASTGARIRGRSYC